MSFRDEEIVATPTNCEVQTIVGTDRLKSMMIVVLKGQGSERFFLDPDTAEWCPYVDWESVKGTVQAMTWRKGWYLVKTIMVGKFF